jgi:cytoskeletal protein RodZ
VWRKKIIFIHTILVQAIYMSRNIWVGVVVVIVLVAGGWWYLNQSNAPATSETTQLPTEQTTQQNTNTYTPPVTNTQSSQPAQQTQTNTQSQQTSNLMQPGETRPIGGATPQCVPGYSVEQSGNVWKCVAIKVAPQGVTIDQSPLVSSIGNPVLSGQAGTITKGSDLYVSVYSQDGKVWGSGNSDPVISNGHWSIQVGAPDTSFRLVPGTYTVYVGDPRTPLATGTLRIDQ